MLDSEPTAPIESAPANPTPEPVIEASSAPEESRISGWSHANEPAPVVKAPENAPAGDAPATNDTAGEAAKPKERVKFEFGGRIPVAEVEADSPIAATLREAEVELKHRRKAEGERTEEVNRLRKELEDLKAAPPTPATPGKEGDSAPTDEALAELIQQALDDGNGTALAKIILDLRKSAKGSEADPVVEALKAELEKVKSGQAALDPIIDAQRQKNLAADVIAYVKETHQADLTPEQAESVRDRAQASFSARMDRIGKGISNEAKAEFLAIELDAAYRAVAAAPAAKTTTNPNPSPAAPAPAIPDRRTLAPATTGRALNGRFTSESGHAPPRGFQP